MKWNKKPIQMCAQAAIHLIAAKCGAKNAEIRTLLEQGAQLELQSRSGRTPGRLMDDEQG